MVDSVASMFSKSNHHAQSARSELEAALSETQGATKEKIQKALDQIKEIETMASSAVTK